ncbi:MAG: hypothetical protein COV55_00500 [Candidatus Komeilibacteria bacterium CG11_big_fil_rev_8_21_14_0_20_36_20]|uniref:Uncharacterized protein n=1 Tax=Candidatus Komeilibacteria bacterium CG11_big_fil_rev_8_21_14_0_20_36_20 TaxID=1974477 RepID=A0A2H0NE92_9BACT|nr:MAG: hypothetical protein COV55_00500 [Candidatus Komeilibacteria bacterium CG11_big_fil_rev_8_21_14_0_20_36_20]PIR81663.1 MAG: hypothetical protein COU21_02355 [Candidatus Komeilibacteria bacterium CG10_big_fil_rev_8_21_14_0_10_36_65]PJC55594.1 MAG: hypothetical protein CO027_01165 [Candidatus Komeilibacteria bacterium CG_4_9_14_0_2_um_filter_36_13]
MKTSYSFIFFILIFLIVAAIFLILNKETAGQEKTLRQTLGCYFGPIADSVLDLRADTTLVGAFISFREVPLPDETRKELDDLNIVLDERTWIFDYVLGEIPIDSLCPLAEDKSVKSIFIP